MGCLIICLLCREMVNVINPACILMLCVFMARNVLASNHPLLLA
jgi:hypothetical protein